LNPRTFEPSNLWTYAVDSGRFELQVGASTAALRARQEFSVAN